MFILYGDICSVSLNYFREFYYRSTNYHPRVNYKATRRIAEFQSTDTVHAKGQ